jgi:diguanylate cyclase (GGDEF)-like protein
VHIAAQRVRPDQAADVDRHCVLDAARQVHDRAGMAQALDAGTAEGAAALLASLSQRLRETHGAVGDELAVALDRLMLAAQDLTQAARAVVDRRTPAHVPADPDSPRPRVLLVDDDVEELSLLAELLGRDFDVIRATDALDGLRRARHPVVDAVVTDLHMPGVDGLGLLRLLRADAVTAHVPCLLLSGESAATEKLAAFGLGADDYLTKPCDAAEVAGRVHHRIADARRLQAERRLQETDDLTGLPNRRALRRQLDAALTDARSTGRPLALALIDADNLKSVNDRFGHLEGDRVIRAIADALRQCKRNDDTAARLGGDEFAMIMPSTDAEGAERLLERVREEIARHPLHTGADEVHMTVSVGLASLAGDDDDHDRLFSRADAALYSCKRRRRPSTPMPVPPPTAPAAPAAP